MSDRFVPPVLKLRAVEIARKGYFTKYVNGERVLVFPDRECEITEENLVAGYWEQSRLIDERIGARRMGKRYGYANPIWRLGAMLQPAAVTNAWYAADCPPDFDPRPFVSRLTYLRWRVAIWLRDCK